MIDERAEFAAYTGAVVYDATNKQDSAYLGRFTFDTLLRGEGLQRILTIVARPFGLSMAPNPKTSSNIIRI